MQISIRSNVEDLDESFVYEYLPDYIYRLFITSVSPIRLREFNEFFEINSLEILDQALKKLLITKNGKYEYTIKIDKKLKYNNVSLESWITIITYGNREIKGYPILLDIFNFTSDNITEIYEEWVDGN